jgi:hypothetical protein
VTGVGLIRPTSSTAWELRGAWATGLRVSVTIDALDLQRLEGHVSAVSATDAYAVISQRQIPLDRVLAVHRPSLLGDSSFEQGEAWRRRSTPVALRDRPGQLKLGDPS